MIYYSQSNRRMKIEIQNSNDDEGVSKLCRTCVWPAKRLGRPRKAKGDLKFTVYVLTVHKHSWVQRRAGPKVPARARSPKGSSAAVMTTQTYAPWKREN